MGENPNIPHHHDQIILQENDDQIQENDDEGDQEEALSLCNLPLDDQINNSTIIDMSRNQSSSSSNSSDSSEFFEFFSNFTSEMSTAEEIIFCGKLIPFKESSSSRKDKKHVNLRRRSESLSGLNSSICRSNSNNINMMRSSKSLDYRKLERTLEPEHYIERNSSTKVTERSRTPVIKPRWYWLMLGVAKPPSEMELRDIKSRQLRRNSSNGKLPPPVVDSVKNGKGFAASSSLLKVLSCRDPASVAVTTSFCVPPA